MAIPFETGGNTLGLFLQGGPAQMTLEEADPGVSSSGETPTYEIIGVEFAEESTDAETAPETSEESGLELSQPEETPFVEAELLDPSAVETDLGETAATDETQPAFEMEALLTFDDAPIVAADVFASVPSVAFESAATDSGGAPVMQMAFAVPAFESLASMGGTGDLCFF